MDELRTYNLNALKLIHEISNILKEYPEIVAIFRRLFIFFCFLFRPAELSSTKNSMSMGYTKYWKNTWKILKKEFFRAKSINPSKSNLNSNLKWEFKILWKNKGRSDLKGASNYIRNHIDEFSTLAKLSEKSHHKWNIEGFEVSFL